jgi:hypothetical protein
VGQIAAKSIKAGPRLNQIQPNFSKKKAWNSLDSLVRNQPFQSVVATPWAKKFFSFPFPHIKHSVEAHLLALVYHPSDFSMDSVFPKEKSEIGWGAGAHPRFQIPRFPAALLRPRSAAVEE